MNIRKLASITLALMLLSISFSMMASESAEAAFIMPLSNNGLSPTFVVEDTTWNEAGTIAVVVGYDTNPLLPNAYTYHFLNDTYVPIDNGGFNTQRLYSVDHYGEPVYGWGNGTKSSDNERPAMTSVPTPAPNQEPLPDDEILRHTILSQDFSSVTFPPTGWVRQTLGMTGVWNRLTANYAGGVSPEAYFTASVTSGQGISRLYAGPLDTTNMAALKLQWRNCVWDWADRSGVNCSIKTSSDLITWNDAGWYWDDIEMPGNQAASLKSIDVNTADVGSSTFYISWTVTGNSNMFRYWFIDDVLLSGSWFDNMESGGGSWVPTDNGMGTSWQRGNPGGFGPGASYSGTNCWGTNLASNYGNNAIAYLTLPSVDTRGLTQISLSFWMWFVSENGRDVGWVEASTDGSVWNPVNPTSGPPYLANMYGIPGYTGVLGGWSQAKFDLSAYAGGTMWLRFRFVSDGLTTNPGWYIDDVTLSNDYSVGLIPEFQNKYGLPSQTVDHLLTVTNQGLMDDTYDLSTAGNAWPTALLSEDGAAMDVQAHSTSYTGWTRGYWFTAPCDFTITGLRVPTDLSTDVQNIEVMRFNSAIPTYALVTNDFVSLGYWNNVAGTSFISCNIQIYSGNIIGVLGARGTGTTLYNSYGPVTPYTTSINGFSVPLARLGMQYSLNTAPAYDVWTTAGANARIEMEYTIDSIPLAAGQSKNFLARVSIPAGASPNNADIATITTTSQGLPTVSASAQVRTKVPAGMLSTTPTNSATGVGITQNVIVNFGEPMNTATVTYSCTPNPGGWVATWNTPTNTVLTLSHTAFAYSTGYTFQITGGTNIYGIPLGASVAPNPWSFTTTATASATATGPIFATPTSVGGITITYSWTGGTPTSVNLYYTTNGGTTWTLAGNDATPLDNSFAWTVPSSGTYGWIAQAVGGGSTELSPPTAGTVPEATPYVYDNVRPTVGWQSPLNGGTNVALTQSIMIRFSESMTPASFTYTCSPDPGGWGVVWSTTTYTNDRLTMSHTAFAYGTTYTFTITAVTDLAGNNLNPMPYSFSFTTVAAASATATGPTGGPTNVAGITIAYTWTGVPTSVRLYYTTDGGTTWVLAGTDASVDGSFAWTCPSAGTYGWIAQAVGGGSTELSPPTPGTAPEATSYIYDTTSPTLTYRYPPISGTGIAINQNVILRFSETMNTGSLTYTCSPDPGGWGTSWSAFSVTNDQVILSHTAFAYGTTYTFTITGASDVAGNPLATPISWSFTTVAAASATATGPISATPTNVGSVTLTYSYTGIPTSVNLYYTTQTASPYTWTLAGNDATVDGSFAWTVPASGTYRWYAAAVGGGTTEPDPPLTTTAPEAAPYVYENIRPTVISTTPANGATGVPSTQSIIIRFSESMDTASFSYSCSPDPGGWGVIWGSVSFVNDQVTLTHTQFAFFTSHTFTINAITDVAGNTLNPTPYSFSFTTGATATANGPTGGPTNVVGITIAYTYTGAPTSVNLYYSTTGGASWTLAGNDATVDGSFAWTVPVSGSYRWLASAVGGGSTEPSPPAGGTTPETASPYIVDIVAPAPPTGLTVSWVNTLLSQNFTGATFPPTGWATQTSGTTGTWSRPVSANAGGMSPEAMFQYGGSGVGTSRFYAGPFDTTGLTSLDLQWWNMINDYTGGTGVQCRVQTSTDAITWQDAGYLWDDTVTPGSQPASLQSIAINNGDVGSSTFYISWTVTGNSYEINYWYIDYITLSYAGTGFTDDNKLEWVKSTDDGAGSNDVQYYKIYRADSQFGVYSLIDTVSRGTTSYIDIGRGEPDGINWWYIVRAVDTAGNEELNTNAAPEDPTPPTIISTIPISGVTGVAINQNIVITFSEEMNPSSLTYTCSPNPGGWSAVWSTVTFPNDRVILSHTNFAYGTTYTFTVTAAEDLAGNPLAAGAVPNPWSFTTQAAASATATGPTGGPTNIAGVTITYSRIGSPTSVNIYYTTTGGTTWILAGNDATVDGSFAWSCPTAGTYGWIAQAVGGGSTEPSPPAPGTPPESASYIFDNVRPTVSTVVPANTATSVAINQNIVITFSEPVNTATFTLGTTFTISPNPGGLGVSWSGGDTIATITHTNFAYNTLYTCTITTGVADKAGNTLLANYAWSFTTVAAASATASGPISATPTNVASITITYTYTGAPTSVNIYYTTNGGTTWTLAGNDVTPATGYAWTVPASGTYGWFASAVGGGSTEPSPPAGGTPPEATPYIFDNARPTITNTVPSNGAIGVSVSQNVVITFSEAINTATFTYSCSPNPGGWAVSWNGPTNTIATLTHTAFAYGTTYTFTVTAANDMAGNLLNAGAAPNPFSFTTVAAASATATGPTGGPTNVAGVTITYSRTGFPTSVNIYYTLNGGTTWNSAGTDWSVDGSYAWSCPSSGTYGWIAQAVGGGSTEPSPPAPGTPPESSSFIYDNVRPFIVTTNPAGGATGVSITQSIVITFNEPMETSSITYTCSPNPGGWIGNWNGPTNTILTLTHTNFQYGTTYTFTLTAANDLAGNSLIASGTPNPWSFTTVAAASATATGPTSATPTNVAAVTFTYSYTGVPTSINVYYTLNGGLSWSFWGTDGSVDGSYAIFISTSGTYGWIAQATGGGSTETIPPTAGTPPEASSYIFDNVSPTIISTSPSSGATGVGVTQSIVITFSEPMSSISFGCVPDPGGWIFTWSGGNTVVTLTHNAFAYGTAFTCTIAPTSYDVAGNAIVASAVPNPWSFTTIVAATATATGPTGGPTNVASITLTYTWTGTPTSVNLYFTTDAGSNWILAGNDATVDGSFAWVIPYSWGTFAWYASAVGGGSTEPSPPAGGTTPEVGSYVYDGVSPTITVTNPASGSVNVPVTQSITITFSEAIIGYGFTCSPDPGGWGGSWSGNTLTLTHTPFLYNTTYTFQITSGSDLAGNPLAGGAVPNPWTFTTAAGATATATGPTGGPTNLATIVITYSWSGIPTSVNIYYTTDNGASWTLAGGDGSIDGNFAWAMPVSGTYGWLASAVGGGSTESSPPTIGTVPEAGPYIYDAIPPSIVSVSPGISAIDVLGNAPIIITFNEPMEIAYGSATLTPNPGGAIAYWSNGNMTVTIVHNNFPESTNIIVNLNGYRDIAGNSMGAFSWDFTTTNMTIIGYQDVFWICGDKTGGPPATVYTYRPMAGNQLIPMNNGAIDPAFQTLALDNMGNPLCAGSGLSYMYYHDGIGWNLIPDDMSALSGYGFESMTFNPNDGRFYIGSYFNIFYTDPVPFTVTSKCHMFSNFNGNGDDITSIAWNELYNYGLVAEGPEVIKIWPFDYYGDGSLRYQSVPGHTIGSWYSDISWDTDGWNEVGIVGNKGGNRAYWRYYHSNPQLIEGYVGSAGSYTACAMKPPCSPKWLFVPFAGGSIKAQIMEKDESDVVILSVDKPHIFGVDMWKQSDVMRATVLGSALDADTTYTFFIEGNYTRGGWDYWDAMNTQIVITGWYDNGQIGINSVPGDNLWSSDNYRTRQLRLTYSPGNAPIMNYPSFTPNEFSIHSYHEASGYGPDGSYRRVYINVTIGPQAMYSFGGLAQATVSPYHPNTALNDPNTWDLNATIRDALDLSVANSTYGEFGIKRHATIASSGSPSASIPPGSASALLDSPSYILYSINSPYTLNVSIPNLYRNGNPAMNFIPSGNVQARNSHPNSDLTNSDMDSWAAFTVPNVDQCIWGQRILGTWTVPAPENGNYSAGPYYTDFLYPAFQSTWVEWAVTVDAGTQEGTYRGTITITLWSG